MRPGRAWLSRLTNVYAIARRSGVLDTRAGRAVFASAYFAYKRLLEDPYARLARARPELFSAGHILDIGANIGYTATVFARAAGEGFRVYAFEPESFNFALLERAARATAARGRIVPVRAAAGEADGTLNLWRNPAHHGDHRVVTGPLAGSGLDPAEIDQVPVVRLDRFVRDAGIADRIGLVKIDVQGYELAVLRGLRETLIASPGAAVTLEYMPEAMEALGFSPPDLLAELAHAGFTGHVVGHDGSLSAAGPAELDRAVDRSGYVDLLFVRPAAGQAPADRPSP